MELKQILRVLNVNKFALLLIFRSINAEISFLAVILELRFILMPVSVSIFRNKRVLSYKLLRWLLGISIRLLGEADDTLVDVGLAFFDELEDVVLGDLAIIKWVKFLQEMGLNFFIDAH